MTLKFNKVLEVVEVHVRTEFHQAECSSSWVINSTLDFGQLLDFDREYLWNGSSNRQAGTVITLRYRADSKNMSA